MLCVQSMISGFSAAFLGPIATGPFDVIKTRLMAQNRTGELKYKVRSMVLGADQCYAMQPACPNPLGMPTAPGELMHPIALRHH